MADEVYMNVPVVRDMGKKLEDVSEVLQTVAKTLEIVSTTLKAAFFIGFVGAAAVAMIDRVKPFIQQMADQCADLSKAVAASVTAFENGDLAGSNRFLTSRRS